MLTKTNQQPLSESLTAAYLSLQLSSIRKTFEIPDFVVLGRMQSSIPQNGEIDLNDSFISNRHCRIEKRKGQYWLTDLRSRNGTFINGQRISEALLTDCDRIRIGETELIFSTSNKSAENGFLLKSKNTDWQKELDRLPLYAKSNLPVLINGASGSGKEIIARSLHNLSHRANGPFVSVNCSALTESLIESELFGHIRGSFTGASEDRKGAFLSAKGGTLFLDEIGDLPPSLQPKLLRALENQEIKPVGSDRPITVDVRIVTATHKDLAILVKKNLFRQDLYYRLNVLKVKVPHLRDRLEDFDEFIKLFSKSYKVYFTAAAAQLLKEYAWPGQIRELKNFIARASALYQGRFVEASEVNQMFESMSPMSSQNPSAEKNVLKSLEIQMITDKLIETRGNIRKSARELGIPKSTLYDRIKAYRISVDQVLRKSDSEITDDTSASS